MIYSEKFELDRDIKDSVHGMIQVNAHTECDRDASLDSFDAATTASWDWDQSRGFRDP